MVTDDIVTRLRAEGDFESVGDGTKRWESNQVCIEAADEIERLVFKCKELEAELARLERLANG